jgi:hypothetical protein
LPEDRNWVIPMGRHTIAITRLWLARSAPTVLYVAAMRTPRLPDGVVKFVIFPETAVTPTILINNKDLARTQAGRTQQARQGVWQALVATRID